jgi:hypothetical protein
LRVLLHLLPEVRVVNELVGKLLHALWVAHLLGSPPFFPRPPLLATSIATSSTSGY